jgi:hypothetical protein
MSTDISNRESAKDTRLFWCDAHTLRLDSAVPKPSTITVHRRTQMLASADAPADCCRSSFNEVNVP